MLRFPFRQVFGDPANEPERAAASTCSAQGQLRELEARFTAVINP